jgi:hypothetical protein
VPLLVVESASSRVGIGNGSPQMTLDVTGPVRSLAIKAYADANTGDTGFFELFGARFVGENIPDDRLSAVCHTAGAPPGVDDFDFLPLYIDGNPLVLQGAVKPGVVAGGGRGQVVIKGDPTTTTDVLVVGALNYGAIWAKPSWTSSLEFKKDVRPLQENDYAAILNGLDDFMVAYFRYRHDPAEQSPELGLIAEEAPKQVQVEQGISLNETYGYLFAAAKALKSDQQRMKSRIEALKQ